ncbi:protein DEK [Salarias fasciatus]|uniref:DEK-C domain-containing protein n=1 Tax=Salarias fasciatus TaxID=181472 RepID=A0A672GJ42_SALFA|nr:protein DEK [Salarias fasciatus]
MTEVAEEVMDSPVQSEEEVEEQKLSSEGGDARQSHSGAAAGGDLIQGKRVKKTVERLDFQAPKQLEKLRVGDGCGEKLGEIPRTNYQITKMKPADLKPLHTVLFDRPGKMATIKKNLRLFNGFSFDSDSEQFNKKRDKMLKSSNFTNSKLKVMCSVLDLEKKGTHSDLVDRILTFLTSPKSSGKRLLIKKKKKSKKKLSGNDATPQAKKKKKSKPKASSSSSSPKKSKAGNKSKAIVMDSSSDEDQDEEEEEEAGALAEEKPSEKEENSSSEEEEEQEESEEEASKSKGRTSSASKKQTGKRPRTAGKKSSAPRKRTKKSSDQSSSQSKSESESQSESESESDNQRQAKKKKKPLAKTKKADSSSNSKNTHTAEDSSDEDEPLIKMIKKAPSDDQLKETLQNLLKEADLEEMTMKQICQRVFDLYPDHDLSSRKDFIKQTVRALLT